MNNKEKFEELEFQLRMTQDESARLMVLVEKAVALLADAGDDPASFAIYARLHPLAPENDWRDCVARDAGLRHQWRSLLGSLQASFVGW